MFRLKFGIWFVWNLTTCYNSIDVCVCVCCLVWAFGVFIYISYFLLRFISYGICYYCTKTIEWMINNKKETKKNNGHTNTTIPNNNKTPTKNENGKRIRFATQQTAKQRWNCHTCQLSLFPFSILKLEIVTERKRANLIVKRVFRLGLHFIHIMIRLYVTDWRFLRVSVYCLQCVWHSVKMISNWIHIILLIGEAFSHFASLHSIMCGPVCLHKHSISSNSTVFHIKWNEIISWIQKETRKIKEFSKYWMFELRWHKIIFILRFFTFDGQWHSILLFHSILDSIYIYWYIERHVAMWHVERAPWSLSMVCCWS